VRSLTGMAEATLNNEIHRARFLHPNLPSHTLKGTRAGEGANESLREFYVKKAIRGSSQFGGAR